MRRYTITLRDLSYDDLLSLKWCAESSRNFAIPGARHLQASARAVTAVRRAVRPFERQHLADLRRKVGLPRKKGR